MYKRLFKHLSCPGTLGTIITVTNPISHGVGHPNFLMTMNGTPTYWSTDDGTPAGESVALGDTFKIVGHDGDYVIVEEVLVKYSGGSVKTVVERTKILAAAKKSKVADAVLREFFPAAFDDPSIPDWTKVNKPHAALVTTDGEVMLEQRTSGKLKGHCLLSPSFRWTIEKEGTNTVLVARKSVKG